MPAAALPNPDHVRPFEAFRALRTLLNNKEDTAQVFRIVDAMAGKTRMNAFRRMEKSEPGRALLSERPSLLATLSDRAAMAAMPAGSLGRTYYDFIYGENLSADGLVEASEEGSIARQNAPEDQRWFGARMRDQHDLWHVVTGYGREGFGELCLLAFTHAQTKNRGIGVIVLAGAHKWMREAPAMPTLAAVREARRRGKESAWLPEQAWEKLLPLPLEEVRALLRIPAAPIYASTQGEALRLERMVYAEAA